MRRPFIVACVVALAAAAWLTAPALSSGPYIPRAVDFSMPVPEAATARAATAASTVLRAPKRFDLVGLHWRSGRGAVSMRFRRDGGRWTSWVRAASSDEHAPDGARAPLGSDPVWVGGADELQVRIRGPVRGVRAWFENTTGTATAADRAKTAVRRAVHSAFVSVFATPAASAQSSRPNIIPRSAWGADQCPPRHTPDYGTVKAAFIHHTVNANDYTADESAAIVLAICRFHRNTNGWDDIGYNFLVDRYGQIFEGRAGGVDKAVQGAHTQGYNAQSVGISNLGTFTDTPQTDVALRSIGRLVAWKMGLAAQPVTGKVTLVSAGGASNRFPSGQRVTFDRISGHRDANNTECPGSALYAQLPQIRQLASGDYVPPSGLVATAGAPRLTYPDPAQLSGRFLFPDGTPASGASLAIEFRVSGGAFSQVATAATGQDGAWFASIPATHSGFYRARYGGDVLHPGGFVSSAVGVSVVPRLSARRGAEHVNAGSKVVIAGTIAPAKSALEIQVERLDRGGFKRIGAQPVRASGGRYRAAVLIGLARTYRLRLAFRGDRLNPSVRSAPLLIRGVRPVHTGGTVAT